MFYSQYILSKKGPLGTVWIAAHLESRLRKNQIAGVNIEASVDKILHTEVPIALRLSGHLLLGVVRIYSRKVNYLYDDCTDALLKLKKVQYVGSVDLPPGAAKAPFNAVTVPEEFDFYELELFPDTQASLYLTDVADNHVTTRDQITLQDKTDYNDGILFSLDERFPVGGIPCFSFDIVEGEVGVSATKFSISSSMQLEEDVLPPMSIDMDIDQVMASTYKDQEAITKDAQKKSPLEEFPDIENVMAHVDVPISEGDHHKPPNDDFSLQTGTGGHLGREVENDMKEDGNISPAFRTPLSKAAASPFSVNVPGGSDALGARTPDLVVAPTPTEDLLDKGRKAKQRRKRKLFFDSDTKLSSEIMKKHLFETDDIRHGRHKIVTRSCNMASRKTILTAPSIPGLCPDLQELYERVLKLPSISKMHEVLPPEPGKVGQQIEEMEVVESGRAGKQIQETEVIIEEETKTRHTEEDEEDLSKKTKKREREEDEDGTEGKKEARRKVLEESSVELFEDIDMHGREMRSKYLEERYANEHMVMHEREMRSKVLQDQYSVEGMEMHGREMRSKLLQDLSPLEFRDKQICEHGESDKATTSTSDVDTGFLLEEYGDKMTLGGTSGETSDWSGRTRATAKFFQQAFQTAAVHETELSISLMSVLKGKSRKEAANMFFETLVLQTNGYIETIQERPYGDICISPQSELLKAIF